MKQKRFLALLTGCAMLFGFAGCQGNAEEGTDDTEQVTEQTTASTESAVETESKYQKEYDEDGNLYLINKNTDEIIPPFPEGWSGERISKMVTIDGYQLMLPCKVNDILDLSEDFRLDEPFDYGNGTSSYQIWYKDVIAAGGVFNNDSNMIMTINIGGNEYTKYYGANSTVPEEVFLLFNDFPKDNEGSIMVKYFQENMKYGLHYHGNSKSSKVFLSWEEIKIL